MDETAVCKSERFESGHCPEAGWPLSWGHALWQIRLGATLGLDSSAAVSTLRHPLWWRLQSPPIPLLGSIPGHGLRPTDLSRISPRHRDLPSGHAKLYHAGIRGDVSRSTLAEANESRDWRIWPDFAAVLIAEARTLHADDIWRAAEADVYVFDTTTIDLCLTLVSLGAIPPHKSAVKMHTLLDLRGTYPTALSALPRGPCTRSTSLDQVAAGSRRLLRHGPRISWTSTRSIASTRPIVFHHPGQKQHRFLREGESRPVDAATGAQADQTIRLRGLLTRRHYPNCCAA